MKISIHYLENLHFKAKIRDFDDFHLDEPESFHGTDLGPSSVEYFLVGIGGCIASTFAFCLSRNGIPLDDLELVVDGKLKHSGPNRSLTIVNVDVSLEFSGSSEREEKIEFCINNFKQHCVISNSLKQGFPVNVNIKRK